MEREEYIGKDGLTYCKVCGECTQRIFEMPLFDGTDKKRAIKMHVMCSCEQKERDEYEAEQKRLEDMRVIGILRSLSLMDEKLEKANLQTYVETKDNLKVITIIRNYISKFDEMYKRNQGLLLWGPVGTGKSYSAAVIANELLNRKIPVVMTSFIKLIKEVGNFDDDSDKLKRINRAKLLIIDDLGAERGTDYALEKVYDIIDSRYRSNKPIILTTNLEMEQIKNCTDIRYNRIYDRIFEMCYPVHVTGLSWRKREAAQRAQDIKKLLEG